MRGRRWPTAAEASQARGEREVSERGREQEEERIEMRGDRRHRRRSTSLRAHTHTPAHASDHHQCPLVWKKKDNKDEQSVEAKKMSCATAAGVDTQREREVQGRRGGMTGGKPATNVHTRTRTQTHQHENQQPGNTTMGSAYEVRGAQEEKGASALQERCGRQAPEASAHWHA